MKTTQLLLSVIDMMSEQRTYEMDNTKANRLYRRICDILLSVGTEAQQNLICALDNMVGLMLSDMFDEGIIAGMKLTNTMQTIINEPGTVYREIMGDSHSENLDYKEAKTLIHRYEKELI